MTRLPPQSLAAPGAAATVSPQERLYVAAMKLCMRLSDESVPAEIWAAIKAAAAQLGDALASNPALDIRGHLLLDAARVVVTPAYRDSIHAREAFIAAARLCHFSGDSPSPACAGAGSAAKAPRQDAEAGG